MSKNNSGIGVLILCILLALSAKSQVQGTLGVGLAREESVYPSFAISAGYKLKIVVAEAEARMVGNEIPLEFGVKAGIDVYHVSGFVGYYRLYHSSDDKSLNGYSVGYILRWQLLTVNIAEASTRFYAEVAYIGGVKQISAGVLFKLAELLDNP
jgi:hypothetical protein